MNYYPNNRGFSLIEILVVLGLIFFLFTNFFYLWNTSQIFKKGRDSRRINDLQALDISIKNLLATQDYINLGEENIIYISLPDSSSTCGSYNLNKVFLPFSYRCQTNNDYLKTNGQGWLPINFAPANVLVLSQLPVDPLNNANYFYSYQVKNGRYKLTARFEDKNFIEKMVSDGGLEMTLYEVGSDLRIPSPQSGLVFYLPFNEGIGTTAYDLSGYNNNGTLYSGSVVCSNPPTSGCPQWINGKVGKALSFDGVNDYVWPLGFKAKVTTGFTVGVWFRTSNSGNRMFVVNQWGAIGENNSSWGIEKLNTNVIRFELHNGYQNYIIDSVANVFNNGQWHYAVLVFDGSRFYAYLNGELLSNPINAAVQDSTSYDVHIGAEAQNKNNTWNGFIDEVRIYNRVLSTDEIKVIYEASK